MISKLVIWSILQDKVSFRKSECFPVSRIFIRDSLKRWRSTFYYINKWKYPFTKAEINCNQAWNTFNTIVVIQDENVTDRDNFNREWLFKETEFVKNYSNLDRTLSSSITADDKCNKWWHQIERFSVRWKEHIRDMGTRMKIELCRICCR